MKSRNAIIELARTWIGKNDDDGSHKEIVDIYNSHKPWARGVKMKYTWAWCACTWSALGIKMGYTDIIPLEISCKRLIELAKKMDIWVESDSYVPNTGDGILYDFEDDGKGDNAGAPNHIGMVEKVENGVITVIEGNYGGVVKRRKIKCNGKYIRGFICPRYDEQYVPTVKEWQQAAIADGFTFPRYGADGVWGAECIAVASKAKVKKRPVHTNKNLTRIVQKAVGVTVDGLCGKDTDKAIRAFQKENGLVVDGIVGLETWKKILCKS